MRKSSVILAAYHEDKAVEVQLHAFVTSAPDRRERSASCPCCFTPGENQYPLDRRLNTLQSWFRSRENENESLASNGNQT
jgi:hypothetical protein